MSVSKEGQLLDKADGHRSVPIHDIASPKRFTEARKDSVGEEATANTPTENGFPADRSNAFKKEER
jgi:hypothetical protein